MSYLEPSPTNFFRRPYVRDYDPGTFVPDDLPSMWLNYLTGQVFLFVGQTDGVGRWSNITTVAAGQVSNVSITDGTDSALAVMGVFRINNAANSGIVITLGGNIISIMIADGGVISQKIADGAVTRDKLAQDIINDIANAQQSGMIQVNSTNISSIINTAEIQWLVDSINNTASASIQNESIAEGKLDPAVQTKLNATGDRIGFNGTDGENIVNSPDVQWTLNGTDASASIPVQSINQDKLSIAVQTLLNRQLQFNNQDVASVSTGNNIVSNYNAITKNLDLTVQLPSFPQPLQFNNQNVSVLVQGDNIVGTIDNAGRLTFSTNDPITYNGQIITSVDAGANMDIAINEQGHALFSALGGGDATLREFEESLFTRHDPPDSYVSTVEFYNAVISNEDPYTSILEYNDDTYEGQLETLSSDAINCQQDSLFNVITLTVSEASMAGYVLLSDATFYSFTRDATNVIVTVRNSDGTPATRALVDVHRPTRDPNTNAITALTRVNAVNPDSQGDAIMGDVQAHDIIMISAVWEYAEAINYVSVSQDVSLMAGDASRFERRESSEEQGIEDVTFPLRQVRDDVIEKSELLEIVQSDISPGLEEVLEAFYSEKSPSLFFLEVTTPDTNYVECLVIAIRSSLFKRFATGVNTAHIRLMRNVGGTVVDGQVQGGTSSVISDNLNWKLVNRRDSGDNQLGDEVTETLYQTEVNITTETGIYWLEGHTAHNVIVAVVHSSNEARLQAQINFNAQKILQLQQKTHCIHTTQTVNEVTTDDVAVTFIETSNTSRVTDIQILNATYASTVPAVPSSTNAAPRTGVLAIRIAEDLNRNEYVFLLQNADGSFATAGNHNGNEFKNQIQDAGATHDYYALGISADSLELATIMPDQTLVIRKVTSKNEWAGTLADDVVETDDIQDDNVTLPKLSPNVRSMLGGGSGGGGSKSVSTSTFTSTDGTSGDTTTQTSLFAYTPVPAALSGGGTKAFGAHGYRLVDILSSTSTNAPTTDKTLTGAEVAVLGWMNGASTQVLELRGSTNTFELGSSGDVGEDNDPLLLEIWRPTYDQAGVLVSATNVFQMRREEGDLFQNISVQQGDLLLVAEDIADNRNISNSTTVLRIVTRDGVTITTPGTPALGSTTKTSSDETQLFTDLTFDSRQQRNDVTEKATLLDRRITTLTDAESIPFLYLEDTEESAMATISSDNLPGFVENPIFSVRASFIESFKVSEASGVITANIRLMRTRGEDVTVVSETTEWSLRGRVTSATDANMVDISENIFYCVRITDTPQDADIYALEGHTSRHELDIARMMMSGGGTVPTVDETRLFTSATQKRNSNAKTYLLTIVQNTIDDPIREVAVYGTEVQEASTYTILSDDVSGTNFTVRVRSSTLLKANFGTNLRLVITRSGTDTNLAVDSSYIGEGSTIEGGVDSDGNDISDLAFIAINFPVSGNLETDDVVRLETHTSVNILQEQQDIIDNRSLISVLNTAIMNLPTPTTATLPKVLQDIANNVTETNVATGTGTWRRVSPDPYIDRVNISREVALFEDGENRTTTGSDQLTGNTFDDITPEISITTTSPRYYPTGTTIPNQPWPERTSFDEQAVTVENMTGNTTPIQNIWGKIIVFDLYIYDVNNYPTTDVDLLRGGSSGAHPLISMRSVGNEVRVYAETITSRSAGSSTYTYRIQLNANPVIIDGMIGQENNHFIVIPDDWGDEDDIRMRFFLFRKSDHTLFTNVQTVPSSTFDIANLTTAVPEVEFTVSWTLEDGTVISSPYHAEYRAVRNGNGDYTMELSNASLTDNLGSDYQAEVYIDRGTLTSHGSVNNYTQEQMGSGMTTGQSRTFVVTFYPNDDELTNADARLYMVYADSTGFNNNINLDRAIGDDQLAFNRITFNDNPNIHASAVSRMEMYSYTTNPFVPSHSQLIAMWQNRGNYIGLFVHPTRNVMAFRVRSPVEWLADNIGSGDAGGGSKDVTTSAFTSTDGTAGVEGVPAITETTVTRTAFQHYTVGSSSGSKEFDGEPYELWSDTADSQSSAWMTSRTRSSDNINTLFNTRSFTTAEIAILGWDKASGRSFNTFRLTGSYTIELANYTSSSFPPPADSSVQPVLVEIWRPNNTSGTMTSATMVFQMRLETSTFHSVTVQEGDIFLTALWPPNYSRYSTIRLRTVETETTTTSPAIPAVAAVLGTTTKTTSTESQTFNALTFVSSQQRDDVTEKGSLLERIITTLDEPELIPFLYLNSTRESMNFGISDQDTANFVANPIFSVRNSYIEAFKVSEANGEITTNIRIIRTRSGVETTLSETTTWSLRGTVTDAESFHLLDVSENLYWCTRPIEDPQNNDLYRIEGHTEKIELGIRGGIAGGSLRYLNQPVEHLQEGNGIEYRYTARTRTLAINADTAFHSFTLEFYDSPTGHLDVARSLSTADETITYAGAPFAPSLSSVTSSSFVEEGASFTIGRTPQEVINASFMPAFKIEGRYLIEFSSDMVFIGLFSNNNAASQQFGILRTFVNINRFLSLYAYENDVLVICPVRRVNGTNETFDLSDFSATLSTSESTTPNDATDIWFSLQTSEGAPVTNYIEANQLELPDGTTFDLTALTSDVNARLIIPDADADKTSGDIGDIFNVISLTDAELTALNLTSVGSPDVDVFLEFKRSGHYTLNTIGITDYVLHIRPIKTAEVITDYTVIGSYLNSASAIDRTRLFENRYLTAEQGDILMSFYVANNTGSDTGISVDTTLFAVGNSSNSAGTNPALTILRSQFESVSASVSGLTGSYNFPVLDSDNSSAQLSNLLRPIKIGGANTAVRTGYYTIAKFDHYSKLHFFDGVSNAAAFSFGLNATSSLGIASVSSNASTSALNSSLIGVNSTQFFGIRNLTLASATHNVLLVQDTSTTTNASGFKYPNNGYDATASSSNITDVFNLKSLTQAEMRILTGLSSGTFSATNNMVLESRVNGVITAQNGTATGATFSTNSAMNSWIPTYDDSGTLTSRSSRQEVDTSRVIFSISTDISATNTTRVSEVTADSDGFWPFDRLTIKVGDLIVLTSGGTRASTSIQSMPIALAINVVVE